MPYAPLTPESCLWSLGPLDGRYEENVRALKPFLSEGGLICARIRVELDWLAYLAELRAKGQLSLPWQVSSQDLALLESCLNKDYSSLAIEVKKIEQTTKHDVKAVEYFLREHLAREGASSQLLAMIHFGCTSEDINNLAYGLLLKEVHAAIILPLMDEVIKNLAEKARHYKDCPMLSRTHGQAASPTTMGKEIAVFGHRLKRFYDLLKSMRFDGKMNGAVGNYNAHVFVCPDTNWQALVQEFVEKRLALAWNPLTTQIENHDGLALWCAQLNGYHTVALDLVKDFWTYIALGYFQQKVVSGEVGSSTMPHKVNPIDFENAEGNFGLATSLAEHFSRKLPQSRLQRDLSDSTVLRSLGILLGHHVLAQKSLLRGLNKIVISEKKMQHDLDEAVEILAEPIQTVMRAFGVVDAYEKLKNFSRGKKLSLADVHAFIDQCQEILPPWKARLKALTPKAYTGLASILAEDFAKLVLACKQ